MEEDPDRWLADERVERAIAERRQVGWLGRQAGESATFAGVLRDLAEQATSVVVQGAGGRRHRGRLVAVAEDFIVVAGERGETTLLRTAAVATVQVIDGGGPALGDRPPAVARDLAGAVTMLVAQRPRVLLVTADGTVCSGELREASRDVVVLRTGASPPTTIYVAVPFLAEVSLPLSG